MEETESKIIGLLEGIQKELAFQSKLMELQIDLIQGKQQDHSKSKMEMMKTLEDMTKTVKGTPYESILRGVISQVGGKHGS